ncbi:ice-binding family protein [Clostridium sp.]|uniref:ice-binding family protein n=1 Tax=Clostridium sp. TaxID=1506 RepID=UPI001A4D62AF|nr:ice-binding family protein [Clostridium sp.]MBK5241960.1 DUF3494 domain-containing protein [Clostridium sp.]
MKIFNKIRSISLLVTLLMVVMIAKPTVVMAAERTVNLGTTSTFAVLAGSTITNTGTTTIGGEVGGNVDGKVGGDVGLHPGSAFTDQAHVTISDGATHINDPVAIKAKDDLVMAYNDAAGRTPSKTISAELGGTTLKPGVYNSTDGTFHITGTLTLDADGDPNGVFIFQTTKTLTTATDSNVELIDSARFCRTFWQVGSSATLGLTSNFVGHILAMESITANTGAVVQGQLLAQDGAVTLDSNIITNGYCEDFATLKVIKKVVNNNVGTKTAGDFNIHIKTLDKDVDDSPAIGSELGKTYTLAAGDYVVSEDDSKDYTARYSGNGDADGNITLEPGENKTVTITNTYTPEVATAPAKATLHVIKHVVNDNGGTNVAADFKLYVKSADNEDLEISASGLESPGRSYTLEAGNYVVSEDDFEGYTASYSEDSTNSEITLAAGEEKTVIITNNDNKPGVVTPPVVTSAVPEETVVTTTVTGGTLPDTSSHLYELLIMGAALTMLGALGWISRKRFE